MNKVPRTALDVAAHLAGVLCVLAACVAFLSSPFLLRSAWLAYDAPRYREATFVVQRVVRSPAGRRSLGSYELEGLAGGHAERYQPGRQGYSAGQQIPVMHNPQATFRDLRVVDAEGDFIATQRLRVRTGLVRFYAPLAWLGALSAVLMLRRQRVHGVRPVWTYLWVAALVTSLGLAGGLALRLVVFRMMEGAHP